MYMPIECVHLQRISWGGEEDGKGCIKTWPSHFVQCNILSLNIHYHNYAKEYSLVHFFSS